ncbi:MAG: histidine kinase, partial [Nocardioidaceae bacterium]|nr:histidine kinase [Nocardioidaceae bacterium]
MTRWTDRFSVVRAGSDLVVRDTMVRALVVLRVVVLVNTLALGWYRRDNLVHPTAGLVVFVAITVWTGVAVWAYAADERRRAPLLLVDLAVALAAIGVSPWIKGDEMRATLPGFWVMGAVLAWAIQWRWLGGLVAAVAVCAVDLGARVSVDQSNYGNIFLLLIGGPLVGFLSGLLQDMARERDAAERAAAAAAERARLARVVH